MTISWTWFPIGRYSWISKWDFSFQAHQAIARMIGLLALTLTDIDLLPFNPARYHQALVNLLNLTSSVAPETSNFSKLIPTWS